MDPHKITKNLTEAANAVTFNKSLNEQGGGYPVQPEPQGPGPNEIPPGMPTPPGPGASDKEWDLYRERLRRWQEKYYPEDLPPEPEVKPYGPVPLGPDGKPVWEPPPIIKPQPNVQPKPDGRNPWFTPPGPWGTPGWWPEDIPWWLPYVPGVIPFLVPGSPVSPVLSQLNNPANDDGPLGAPPRV